ncbi:MAG: histidine phosphotransferase family protein [Albidovulum sp.]
MASQAPNLTELLSSRICHDLVSPLGAIGNGIELLLMTSTESSPEIALISDSIAHANAKMRLFRIAFGLAPVGQYIDAKEARAILDDIGRGGRIRLGWELTNRIARQDAKLVLLAVLCLETALAGGGQITVQSSDDQWLVRATGDKLRHDPGLWDIVTAAGTTEHLPAAHVQFALFAAELGRRGRKIAADFGETGITLRF